MRLARCKRTKQTFITKVIEMKKLMLMTSLLIAAASSHADLIIASDVTSISSTGQSYNQTTGIFGNYTDVKLNLTAKGDYGTYGTKENIRFYIDGTQLLDWTWNTSGINVTQNYNNYDYTLQGSVSLSTALWSSISADSQLNISWVNGNSVNPYSSQGGSDYVSYQLVGMPALPIIDLTGGNGGASAVAEPSQLALLGLGILATGVARRKRSEG